MYEGFKKLKAMIGKEPGVKNPGAVAAKIGMEKYGKKKFEQHAHEGKSLKGAKPLKK